MPDTTPKKTKPQATPQTDTDGKSPHSWSDLEKTKLLKLIAHKTSAGCATDNSNLKKEGWTNVMNALNQFFMLNLNRKQIKNQKNSL